MMYIKKECNVLKYFDKIDFKKLPNSFVMKCNHGCKWQFIIKNKNLFIINKRLFDLVKQKMTGYLDQEFWCWGSLELQYKGLKPKILVEKYMKADRFIEIYCFNGIPKIYLDVYQKDELKICTYNEDFSYSDIVLKREDKKYMDKFEADGILKQAGELSKKLSQDFKFVRVDWIVYKNKLYFEELTFTPYSGYSFLNKKWNSRFGDWMKLKGQNSEF